METIVRPQYTLISRRDIAKGFTIKEFLHRHLVPFISYELDEDPDASELIALHDLQDCTLPLLICPSGGIKSDPELYQIAQAIGLHQQPRQKVYDLAIMGAGPAGLTAAVYGASEGLNTVVIERHSAGGRAGSTSLIENLIAFPEGLTGEDFTERSLAQAEKFGVEFIVPVDVEGFYKEGEFIRLALSGGAELLARSVIIATGVQYRILKAKGVERLTGSGIYYGTAKSEALRCRGKEVYVVGGANSAGQAAMYFSRFAKKVYLMVRAGNIEKRMSHYLVQEIYNTPNIEVMPYSEIIAAHGERALESMDVQDVRTQEIRNIQTENLFLLIGGVPHTKALGGCLMLDEAGFILTGREVEQHPKFENKWLLQRPPYSLETNIPGVMAIGDVRRGSVKRMAAAIGDGATAVSYVDEYLTAATVLVTNN